MDRVTLRQKQIDVATAMLNLNSREKNLDWRALIYDTIGENILAPLFSIQELKIEYSVIENKMIHTEREEKPGVAAIYFVMPTSHNIDRICKDLTRPIYDSYYLNFISPLSRLQLETIAEAALQSESTSCVEKVLDQYMNFIALEDDLFVLRETENQQISHYALNRSDATDEEITVAIDIIVEGLFSVMATYNKVPIIRCPKGGAAEFVARKLNDHIRDALRDGRQKLLVKKDDSFTQRPLLCLVDRTIDMSTPLHHTWTYQALIHDLFNTKLNMVKITENLEGRPPKARAFDLNPKDKFWEKQKGAPFPQVAEAVQESLDEYKKREDTVKNPIGLDGPGDEIDIAASTARLVSAAGSVQELLENKKVIENHTTIATAVLDEIKARKLDNFFEIEEKIMNRNLIDRIILDDMLTNPDYGQPNDKYRLFLISYTCDNPSLSEKEAEQYMITLESLGCNRSSFEYIKQWKTFSRVQTATMQKNLQSSSGVLKTAGMFSKLMSQGSQFVMEGVKNLVIKEHYLPLTKLVDGLMDASSKVCPEAQDYLYLDPKTQDDNSTQQKKVFQEAIVFVVGGGNYIEYQNLVDYSNSKRQSAVGPSGYRQVIYGSTDLMNASQFLIQLEKLGQTDADMS